MSIVLINELARIINHFNIKEWQVYSRMKVVEEYDNVLYYVDGELVLRVVFTTLNMGASSLSYEWDSEVFRYY